MPARKPNQYLVDEKLGICRITTSLTKSLNKGLKLWKTESIEDIHVHDFEVIIDNDKNLIKMLKENYLIFYNNAADIRRAQRKNPHPVPNDSCNGYFWGWNIHIKKRYPFGRILWEFSNGKRGLSDSQVVDHNNDMHNLCTFSNLTPMTQQQNKSKLRYPRRIVEPYSITMVSHPDVLPIKLLRFKDNDKKDQELLIYSIENGIELLLDDLNSFKKVSNTDSSAFKQHFKDLKKSSKNYLAHTKQATTGDMFTDELFHYSIDWHEIDEIVRAEHVSALAG